MPLNKPPLPPLPFLKMHGLGNDFVIIDGRKNNFLPDQDFCLRLANRHRGIGYDQLIILSPPQNPEASLLMHFYNSDGSTAGACGNGTRCVARFLFETQNIDKSILETSAGLLPVWRTEDDLISVDFGPPRLMWDEIPLAQNVDTLNVDLHIDGLPPACCVNMGNPHAVFFVPDVELIDLNHSGKMVETHPFFPTRTNVEFAQILSPTNIRMRVFERGTGITEACGSGACATLVAASRRQLSSESATIHLDGGDLMIAWRSPDKHVILTGPTALSFYGTLGKNL